MTQGMIKISVIVPAYNEQSTIIDVLELIKEQTIDGAVLEVIVINDGSQDKTYKLLTENPQLYAKFIHQPNNKGKGSAVKAGLKCADGDYILFQDADLEYDPVDFKKLLEPAIRFNADVVMGSRLLGSPITSVSYFWHKLGNRLITFVFNLLNNTTFTDIYSCYLLYKRSLFQGHSLKADGWEQHAEILSKAVTNGSKFFEVPINYYGRSYKEGKKIRGYHIFSILWTIFSEKLSR